MRGKSGANRTPMGNAAQMTATQVSQNAGPVVGGGGSAVTANAGTQVMQQQQTLNPSAISTAPTVSAANKVISQAASMQAITSMAQAK